VNGELSKARSLQAEHLSFSEAEKLMFQNRVVELEASHSQLHQELAVALAERNDKEKTAKYSVLRIKQLEQ
jgi:hypothetical protein